MAKLTQRQLKLHREAEELLKSPRTRFTSEEAYFIMANWLPDSHTKTAGAAFFTPPYLGSAVEIEVADTGSVVDLGAGIGTLAWFQARKLSWHGAREPQITCVELNPDFIRVGKRLVPQAHWVEGDIFDQGLWLKLGTFDSFITNPPFGPRATNGQNWLTYRGNLALLAVEVGIRVSRWGVGTAILPQALCPFVYSTGLRSGGRSYRDPVGDGQRFLETWPGISFSPGCLDTLIEPDDETEMRSFQDTKITVEIVNVEWREECGPKPVLSLVKEKVIQGQRQVALPIT